MSSPKIPTRHVDATEHASLVESNVQPGTFVVFTLDLPNIASYYPPDSDAWKVIVNFPILSHFGLVTTNTAFEIVSDKNKTLIRELNIGFISYHTPPGRFCQNNYIPIGDPSENDPEQSDSPPLISEPDFPL